MKNLVLGKRVTVGAALYGLSEALQAAFPEQASIIGGVTVAVVFGAQIWIANALGVTTK